MGTANPSFIVGVIGSAGALNAYKSFLNAVPANTGMAYVIISHMSPTAESQLANILSRKTKMPTMVASEGIPIRKNHVYVIPSNADLFMESYTFKVVSPRTNRSNQGDLFLTSLAEAMGTRAIGIVLSGYGGDGTQGCMHIKAKGGTTFAQDSSAEVGAMPLSAQASGSVDFVLPPEQMPRELKRLAKNAKGAPAETTPERAKTDESLRVERANADDGSASMRSTDAAADKIVNLARTNADVILAHARQKADDKLAAGGSADDALHHLVENERAQEDSALKQERAAADTDLRQERERRAVLIGSALLSVREETDSDLSSERDRSDVDIANRDDFLGMVAHDLRNHLNSISLEATLNRAQSSDSAEGRRNAAAMKRMQSRAKNMGQIVEDLVDAAGIDAGKLVVRPQPGDASVLLTEAADAFAAAAAERRISLVVERGKRPLDACFDHPRMLQVLSNLLSNAIKFTPPGGRVVLRGECDGKKLRFTVSDTGSGIPPGMLEAVFERFRQVGQNDQRGLGLGLHISRCIIQGHHGTIRVKSRIGKGSTFIATIPCVVPA